MKRGPFTKQIPKINYQLKLDEIIKNLNGKRPTVLLHSCCGPCSSYVMEYLEQYFAITVLYYNPCIAPEEEYEHRKAVQLDLISQMNAGGSDIHFMDCDHEHESFLTLTRGHETDREGGERCHMCYEQRLRRTAELARSGGFDWFCSTLTVSPYKNAQWLNQLGLQLQAEYDEPYLVSDFKKRNGYKRSIELSYKYNLYRQDFCGCEFSWRNTNEEEKEKEG